LALLYGGGLVASASWLLAEYFTRRRHMALPSILVTMPSRAARQLAPRLGLVMLKPPAQVTPYGYRLLWHERSHDDPGAVWLRRLVIDGVKPGSDGA